MTPELSDALVELVHLVDMVIILAGVAAGVGLVAFIIVMRQ